MRKLINVAIVCSVITVPLFVPVTGYALQRASNAPSVVLQGHSDPPITIFDGRLQSAPNTPSIIVLNGHPEPPISISRFWSVSNFQFSRASRFVAAQHNWYSSLITQTK